MRVIIILVVLATVGFLVYKTVSLSAMVSKADAYAGGSTPLPKDWKTMKSPDNA